MCNVELVVTGPRLELGRFIRAVQAKTTRGRQATPAVLSFAALAPAAPKARKAGWVEPFEPQREPTIKIRRNVSRVIYGFQTTRSPLIDWVPTAATAFPGLVFVVGWVELNRGKAGSLVAGRGSTREYTLGARRKEAIYRKYRRRWGRWVELGETPADEDNALFAEWEADSEVMGVVISRWDYVTLDRVRSSPARAR